MSGLGLTFLRRGNLAHPTAGSDYILSEKRGDPEVFRILMGKGISTDGIGITIDDLKKLTTLQNLFTNNTIIKRFPELQYCTGLTKIYGSGYGGSAFNGCTNLEEVIIPPNVTSIGYAAFNNTPNLVEVTFLAPEKIVTIENNAFYNCGITGTIYFPNLSGVLLEKTFSLSNVKRIESLGNVTRLAGSGDWGTGVFKNCTSLRYAYISAATTKLETAFPGCTALEVVVMQSTTPPAVAANTFPNNESLIIYVPDTSVDAYKTADVWVTKYASRIKPLSEYNG